MKKFLLTTFLFALISVSSAQSWCPPGATWSFRLSNIYMQYENGYLEFKNTQTITVNGITCNQLIGNRFGRMGWQGNMPLSPITYTVVTYENNGVIFYQTGPQRFDTIANFNAGIGGGWYVNGWDSSCVKHPPIFEPRKKIVVLDTGHTQINGFSLKSLTVTTTAQNTSTYTIVERVGPLKGFLHQYYCCASDCWNYLGDFNCYKDDGFGIYSKPGVSACNFVSVKETSQTLKNVQIYPNPVNEILTIELNLFDESGKFVITDVLGQTVLVKGVKRQDLLEPRYQLDVSELKEGIYFLQVLSREKLITTKKIIKE